jgi:hypothetical protein
VDNSQKEKDKKYMVFVTPKAFVTHKETLEKLPKDQFEVYPISWINLNNIDSAFNIHECDNTLFFVTAEEFKMSVLSSK